MRRTLGAAALAIILAGCDEGPTRTPTAPPPAPPPPPPFSASFTAGALEVREGETLTVAIEYRVRELTSSTALGISTRPDSASPEDFAFDAATVVIPAGEDISGVASVEIRALTDSLFAEGEEVLALAFAPTGAASSATLGDPVAVTIVEAGASPCPGVTIRAEPWRQEEWRESRDSTMLASTLGIDLAAGALDTRFELIGPYHDLYEGGSTPRSIPTFGIGAWQVHAMTAGIRHELQINWPGESWFEEETSLQFRFLGPACSGEPIASCSSESCEVLP